MGSEMCIRDRLGIAMGTPYFQAAEQLRRLDVVVRSSNYALYGDMSQRVMAFLGRSVPDLEVYSIDEAFARLPALPPDRWYAKEEADVRVEPITGGRWRRRVDESYASYGDSFESFRGTPLPSPGDSYAQDSFHTPELSRSRPRRAVQRSRGPRATTRGARRRRPPRSPPRRRGGRSRAA